MTKTIEELASEYYLNEVINGDTCDDKDGWTDCFVSGADALMQLPLASRLTAEEKERVRKEYGKLLLFAAIYKKKLSNSVDAVCTQLQSQNYQFYVAQIKLLERIFGADFFKEGE